ncbi:MAG: hypothetical protein H7Y00_03010, partial [Fimbriimonadaceae bacterium]|nr:hypothetical protein [Chitinophagales bacterium]
NNTEDFFSSEEFFFSFRQKLLFDEYAATKAKKKSYNFLSACMEDFTTNYFLEMLRMYSELVNRKNLRMADFDEKSMQVFLNYFLVSQKNNKLSPTLLIYYQILLFLIDETNKKGEKAYSTYKNYLQKHLQQIPLKTAREICLFGQNFCVKNINLNKHLYLNELLELYNLMLKHNVMYDGQYLTEWTFKNYVTVALRLKAFKQAENFIETYHSKLSPDVAFNAYHYNLAALYYEQNNFDKALDELNEIHFSDTIYYLDARSILLKIYFTQENFEALASLYHSVRVYLLRNKQLSRKLAERYRNIFLYTYKLSLLINKKEYIAAKEYKVKYEQLGKKINQNTIANKPWLLKQFEDAA